MYSCLNKMKSSNVSFDFNEVKSFCGMIKLFSRRISTYFLGDETMSIDVVFWTFGLNTFLILIVVIIEVEFFTFYWNLVIYLYLSFPQLSPTLIVVLNSIFFSTCFIFLKSSLIFCFFSFSTCLYFSKSSLIFYSSIYFCSFKISFLYFTGILFFRFLY